MADTPSRESPAGLQSRRSSPRVAGPFEGRRRGALTVDVKILDLSVGGCLVESFHDVSPGRRIRLDLELPGDGCVTVEAETLYSRPDCGFAVKFVNLSDEARQRIERVVARRSGRQR